MSESVVIFIVHGSVHSSCGQIYLVTRDGKGFSMDLRNFQVMILGPVQVLQLSTIHFSMSQNRIQIESVKKNRVPGPRTIQIVSEKFWLSPKNFLCFLKTQPNSKTCVFYFIEIFSYLCFYYIKLDSSRCLDFFMDT